MSGGDVHRVDPFAALRAPAESISGLAWQLQPLQPHERPHLLRDETALLLDGLLARVARGQGAIELAIGDALDALSTGDRLLRIGYSRLHDYARERLGSLTEHKALDLARLARELRARPLLRAAVRSGVLSVSKAEAILPVARGDAEASWVERARGETVRALRAAVRAAGKGPEEDERWERVQVALAPEARAKVGEAMALAGKLLGQAAPRWQRLEAICAEYLAEHPTEVRDDERSALHDPVSDALEAAREGLEHEMNRWEWLETIEPVAVPEPSDGEPRSHAPFALTLSDDGVVAVSEGHRLDSRLRELDGMHERWDELVGHLALLMLNTGVWRDMGFVNFAHYCSERLGMSERAIQQRAALERRLHALPSLRAALREGRVSYEKARLVARHADETTVDALIVRAQASTCIALRRELEAAEEAQMSARRVLDLPVPRRVASLLDAACRAAREAAGKPLSPQECLVRVAEHFIATWKDAVTARRTRQQRVLARDDGWCTVPGCSRPAMQAHHVVFRSRGGTDDPWNQTGMCPPHHLHCLHNGWIRVTGRAPDALVWELPAPPGPFPRTARGEDDPTVH
jgi:5-methylcytosine-specific restriction endonuclease McrA